MPALMRACAARGIAATDGRPLSGARPRESGPALHAALPGRPAAADSAAGRTRRARRRDAARARRRRCAGQARWRQRLIEACIEALPALFDPASARTADRPEPALPVARAAPHARGRAATTPARWSRIGPRSGRACCSSLPAAASRSSPASARAARSRTASAASASSAGDDGTLRVAVRGPDDAVPGHDPVLDLERGLAGANVDRPRGHRPRLRAATRGRRVGDSGHPGTARRSTATPSTSRPGIRASAAAATGSVAAPARWRCSSAAVPGCPLTVALDGSEPSGVSLPRRPAPGRPGARGSLGDAGDPALGGCRRRRARGRRAAHRSALTRSIAFPWCAAGRPVPLRLLYASCRLPGVPGLAGWCEVGGV